MSLFVWSSIKDDATSTTTEKKGIVSTSPKYNSKRRVCSNCQVNQTKIVFPTNITSGKEGCMIHHSKSASWGNISGIFYMGFVWVGGVRSNHNLPYAIFELECNHPFSTRDMYARRIRVRRQQIALLFGLEEQVLFFRSDG
jgi:hypothetical protein